MKILDIISSQWAILPEALNGIFDIMSAHKQGEKLDLKAMEKAIIDFSIEEQQPFEDNNESYAIININGVLEKRPGMLERLLFDAVGTEQIKLEIEKAIEDESIDNVILMIDSPGGTVDGTKELADYIYNSRGKKKITAYSDGMIASAAYWIASAADEIYISNETVNIGSIGVITSHIDASAYNQNMGVKVTDIFSGEYKAAGSQNRPLDDKSKAYIQDRVDSLYSIFVSDVARNRGVSVDFVLENMADGRVFLGLDAISNKLVDGVSAIETIIGEMKTMKNMDEFKAHEFFGQAKAEIEKSMQDKFSAESEKIKDEAIESERKRISDIQALAMPGYEKILEAGILDGSTAADISIKMIKAQKDELVIKAEELEKDAPEVLPEVEPIVEPEKEDARGFIDLVKDYAIEHKVKNSEARTAVIREYPEKYKIFKNGGK